MARSSSEFHESEYPYFLTCIVVGGADLFFRSKDKPTNSWCIGYSEQELRVVLPSRSLGKRLKLKTRNVNESYLKCLLGKKHYFETINLIGLEYIYPSL